MSNPKKKGTGVKLWTTMTVVMAVLLVASIIGTNFAMGASQAINIFLKTETYKIESTGETTATASTSPVNTVLWKNWKPPARLSRSRSPQRALFC